jgi:hypothetical protein
MPTTTSRRLTPPQAPQDRQRAPRTGCSDLLTGPIHTQRSMKPACGPLKGPPRSRVEHCVIMVPQPLRHARFFILVADVHRRVAPIGTSLEWLLLFASHQNVIRFEKDARPRLASKPSHKHSNDPCGHCSNRCPKCAADVGAHLLFLARPLNFSFTEPTQGEQPLWVGIDARAMTDRVEHSTFPVGFKLGAPRGLLLQVCHSASRKVSTVPQLDDDTLPQQWHSNPSVSQPISLTAATGAFSPFT